MTAPDHAANLPLYDQVKAETGVDPEREATVRTHATFMRDVKHDEWLSKVLTKFEKAPKRRKGSSS